MAPPLPSEQGPGGALPQARRSWKAPPQPSPEGIIAKPDCGEPSGYSGWAGVSGPAADQRSVGWRGTRALVSSSRGESGRRSAAVVGQGKQKAVVAVPGQPLSIAVEAPPSLEGGNDALDLARIGAIRALCRRCHRVSGRPPPQLLCMIRLDALRAQPLARARLHRPCRHRPPFRRRKPDRRRHGIVSWPGQHQPADSRCLIHPDMLVAEMPARPALAGGIAASPSTVPGDHRATWRNGVATARRRPSCPVSDQPTHGSCR